MAMTQLGLMMMGGIATLATIGMFKDFGDDETRVIMSFGASVLWGFFGMSSFDVIVRSTSYASASEPITPLAYMGIGLSIITGFFAIWMLLMLVKSETSATDLEGMMR